jgi:trehalose 6-phosphate phosphatase
MTGSPDRLQLAPPPVTLLRGASLFLDFDGTLVEIAAEPDAVQVTSQLRQLLTLLQERLDGRVAILTGRAVDDVEARLQPVRMVLGGSHGLETRINGASAASVERPLGLDQVVAELRALQQRYPGVIVEEKPFGVALHYRQAPEAEDACHAAVAEVARRCGLELQPGKMVFELKPPGGNKGAALLSIMEEPAFAGTRPVFLGDDLTDEPGFAAALQLGGAGVLIGEQRETEATYRLASVRDALAWLGQAAAEA